MNEERGIGARVFFSVHVFLYVAVLLLLTVIWLTAGGPGRNVIFWPLYVFFGWGSAVGVHSIAWVRRDRKRAYFPYHLFLFLWSAAFFIFIDAAPDAGIGWAYWPIAMWFPLLVIHAVGRIILVTRRIERQSDDGRRLIRRFANVGLFCANALYFVVVNLLVAIGIIPLSYNPVPAATGEIMGPAVQILINWGALLLLHAGALTLFYRARTMSNLVRGLVIDAAAYVVVNALLLVSYLQTSGTFFWNLFPLAAWVCVLAAHVAVIVRFPAMRAASLRLADPSAAATTDGPAAGEAARHASHLLGWQISFIFHVTLFVSVLALMTVVRLTGLGYPVATARLPWRAIAVTGFSWLIALGLHGAIYWVTRSGVRGVGRISSIVHLALYAGSAILFVALDLLTDSAIGWSLIALFSWAIALGLHLLIVRLTGLSRDRTVHAR